MQILLPGDHMQFPNRTVLPKSPFAEGGLSVPPPFPGVGQKGFFIVLLKPF